MSAMPPSIELAVRSIGGLIFILPAFPPEASLDLWRHYWPWLRFLHRHQDLIARSCPDPSQMYLMFSRIVARLNDHGPTARLIDEQAGVQAISVRTWMLMLNLPEDRRKILFVDSECAFIMLMKPSKPGNFREMVDEAGGLDELAALVVRHIALSVPHSAANLLFSSLTATFLEDTDDRGGPFQMALQSAGIITALIKALPAYDNITHPMIPGLRSAFLLLLKRQLDTPPGYTWMPEALDAGLLGVLVRCAIFYARQWHGVENEARDLLHLVLRSLVYPSVISRMEQCLRDVEHLAKGSAFQNSFIFTEWQKLKKTSTERLVVLKDFEHRKHTSLKACDNLECNTPISSKAQFMRCACCETAYYCSPACQTVDWKTGGHREICRPLRSTRLREPPLTRRERAFLRLLLYHEYKAAKPKILREQIIFMNRNPDTAFYTSFEYTTEQRATTSVLPISIPRSDTSAEGRDWAALWKGYKLRAARSEGKMELHLLVVGEGPKSRKRLLVMRSASGAISEARKVMAADRDPTVRMVRELRDVVALDVLEIY
ncbi:hypothetical protein FB451DRAFT_1556979 [Mycena latifolia]|nr:hypothetical protein FB451DRAFT_1556979 [Mycena latifolia]